jgi:hypothetical protein
MATTEKPVAQPPHAPIPPVPPAQPLQPKDAASTEEKKPEEKVLSKEEAKSLFQGGHRLKKKGDPPDKWIAATRLHNQLCLARPLDEEMEKTVLGQELVLLTD